MRRLLPCFLLLVGCEGPTQDSVKGQLAQLELTRVSDDCVPRRRVGDAGLQFFAVRDDGGVAFTMSQDAQYGPLFDGGALESVQQQAIPVINGGQAQVGADGGCAGTFANWVLESPGVLRSLQKFPGEDTCPDGPEWLPKTACTVNRTFTFTGVSDCDSKCLKFTASNEVTCDC